MSSGLTELDEALDGLYWGDNVVWLLAGGDAQPFYAAIARDPARFDRVTWVALDRDPAGLGLGPGVGVLDVRPQVTEGDARGVLAELRRHCVPGTRTLLLFEPLDVLVGHWGAQLAARFYAACCPTLLGLGALAYWSVSLGERTHPVVEAVERVSQCVLRLDGARVAVLKAEGRAEASRGAVMSYRLEGAIPRLSRPSVSGQVASSLRAIRRGKGMSQGDLARFAGVTPSAISQAERGERGLSLDTLVRLSSALGLSLDDLVHSGEGLPYRLGRRIDDPAGEQSATQRLLEGADGASVSFVRLAPRAHGEPPAPRHGRALITVAGGLVQVLLADSSPVLRRGEVLLTEAAAVSGWRNLGDREATLHWIVDGGTGDA